LIRPTVWPQCTNVTDRTGQTDRQDRQQSDSIGRTVLQTVAQKPTASMLQCCCKVNNTTGAKYKYDKSKSRFARFWLAASAATENSAAILSCGASCGGPASPVRLSPTHRCHTHVAPACSFGEPSQCKQPSAQHAALSDIVHG